MYDARRGILPECIGEGTHFKIPYFQVFKIMHLFVNALVLTLPTYISVQQQHIMSIRAEPKEIKSRTGTKDLQMVQIALRVLSRPKVRLTLIMPFLSPIVFSPCSLSLTQIATHVNLLQEHKLPEIYTNLGVNFNDRVLPSVGNEVLKATVARYNAEELLSKRSVISLEIKQELEKRANTFGLELIDVAITVRTALYRVFEESRLLGFLGVLPLTRSHSFVPRVVFWLGSRVCSTWCSGRSSPQPLKRSRWRSKRPTDRSGWWRRLTRSGRPR